MNIIKYIIKFLKIPYGEGTKPILQVLIPRLKRSNVSKVKLTLSVDIHIMFLKKTTHKSCKK